MKLLIIPFPELIVTTTKQQQQRFLEIQRRKVDTRKFLPESSMPQFHLNKLLDLFFFR
jgi:hypothetical protein